MSENILENEESQSLAPTSDELMNEDDAKSSVSFSIYDGMLAISLVCIAIAIMLLIMELRTFGNFPFVFPWNTAEVLEGGG